MPAGRPTKLNADVTKTITDAIAIGATYQAAAEYAGISYDTFNEWMKGNRAAHRKFSEAVRQANAQCRIRLLAKIQGSEDWRSKAWILERRFPDEYALKVKQEHTGPDGGPIETKITEVVIELPKPADG